MDRKSILILIVTAGLFVTWPMLVNKIYPPLPAPKQTNAPTLGTNRSLASPVISAANTNRAVAPLTNGVALASGATNTPVGKEENITVENQWARYHFSSSGGGLTLVELKEFKSYVGCKADKATTNPPASLNKKSPVPMFEIRENEAFLEDNVFRLSTNGQTVRAEKSLTNGMLLVKEFQILTNYQLKVTTRWENHGTAPVRLPARQLVIGTATPMGAYDQLRTIGLDWYDGKDAHRTQRTFFEPSSFLFVFNRPGKDEYSGGSSNVQWAATHNQFFTTVVTPQTPVPTVIGRPIDLPAPSPEEIKGDARTVVKPSGIVGFFSYPEITVPEGQSFVQDYHVYAGPKEYKTLSRLSNDVDLVMNLEGFWGWFAKMLLLAMNGLHSLGVKYGWAIVLITVILKLVFYPLTAASTRSMKRMSSLQPQMKAIQEKYKEDPTKMNQKLQEFMKEHRINPLGSCLPLLLTIPVFAGFWKMLYSAIELRGAEFLWACDLSAPDTLVVIPGLNIPINGFALIMIASMMWQSHMTPPSPGVDPAQQKMMRYMPLAIVPFIYNQAAGLTLYWSVQNLLSIIQMKLTRDKPEKPGKPAPAAPAPRRKA
jgi:YidC/Oxa1 family membrane protein insertase